MAHEVNEPMEGGKAMLRRILFACSVALASTSWASAQYDSPIPKGPPATTTRPMDPRTAPSINSLLERQLPPDPKPTYRYELRPEHGAFLVCVRSFKAADRMPEEERRVKELAEGFVEYIRTECRLNAYILERGWVQRQERTKEKEEYLTNLKKHYEKLGEPIPDHFLKLKMPRIPNEYNVFVAPARGTLKDLDAAIDFAKQVRQLKTPPSEFTDSVFVSDDKAAGRTALGAVNPFLAAFPGPNPTAAKKPATIGGIQRPIADEFLMRLNSGDSYSLIHKTKKTYTLLVQSYGTDTTIVRPGTMAPPDDKGERLERAAQQANTAVRVLRVYKPTSFEAYVLHTRYYSVVCVGQYDSPDDPQLKANREALAGLEFKEGKTGRVLDKLMDKPAVIMIPRPE